MLGLSKVQRPFSLLNTWLGEFDSDVGEDELDEELALPDVLKSISYEEKKELFRFKHAHNEVFVYFIVSKHIVGNFDWFMQQRDWEEEMLRRSDLLARKIDMERLKRMSNKGAVPSSTKATTKKAEAKVRVHGNPIDGIAPDSFILLLCSLDNRWTWQA